MSDDLTIAAARAATPPRSQLDLLAVRVTELEARMQGMAEHNKQIVQLIENLYKMQMAMVEEVRSKLTELAQPRPPQP